MSCPFYLVGATSERPAICAAAAMPFEPTVREQREYCSTDRHGRCPWYQYSSSWLWQAIHQEVARAIG
ncbi:MAG: hypothetical protein ACE5NA_05930 [Nitrospiraceae bacterium]